ncbi:MAG: hypothetical protein CM1200mP9_08410 [Gammaproteobacteria bacterium]|nr:MAG: hypothetical protein CM1200mP9_08410 [Gammaproteobacteria bacterium]
MQAGRRLKPLSGLIENLPKAMSPDDVGETVFFKAFLKGDFYIFSHPEVALLPELRASAVKENEYPLYQLVCSSRWLNRVTTQTVQRDPLARVSRPRGDSPSQKKGSLCASFGCRWDDSLS